MSQVFLCMDKVNASYDDIANSDCDSYVQLGEGAVQADPSNKAIDQSIDQLINKAINQLINQKIPIHGEFTVVISSRHMLHWRSYMG